MLPIWLGLPPIPVFCSPAPTSLLNTSNLSIFPCVRVSDIGLPFFTQRQNFFAGECCSHLLALVLDFCATRACVGCILLILAPQAPRVFHTELLKCFSGNHDFGAPFSTGRLGRSYPSLFHNQVPRKECRLKSTCRISGRSSTLFLSGVPWTKRLVFL